MHAVPTRATATAAEASEIIRDTWAFVKGIGSCLIVGSAYHKNTNTKVERADGGIKGTVDTLLDAVEPAGADGPARRPYPGSG